jgi:hypothetical protein
MGHRILLNLKSSNLTYDYLNVTAAGIASVCS